MAKRVLRSAIVVNGTEPVNTVVLPVGDDGDAFLAAYDGTAVIPDEEDEYGEDLLTITGCLIVEITGMDPMPAVGVGWTYVDGAFVAPPVPEDPDA